MNVYERHCGERGRRTKAGAPLEGTGRPFRRWKAEHVAFDGGGLVRRLTAPRPRGEAFAWRLTADKGMAPAPCVPALGGVAALGVYTQMAV